MKTFKPNANYFGRKSGTLEDIVQKINEANPKPEVFDIRGESKEYKAVFAAAMKKFKISSPGELKGEEEKKKFFDYVDSQYKAKGEQMDDKAQMANQSRKMKDGEKAKMSVKETVRDMLLKSWKQAADLAEKNKVSEGELPPALQKHIAKKKKDKEDKSEDMHKDKKKDMKAGYMKAGYMKASYGKKK